jgi:hypothetical protein
MKKALSLYEQVQAAKQNVNTWPESVKSATNVRYSDFFPDAKRTSTETAETKKNEKELAKA